jgi:hypothetical protein
MDISVNACIIEHYEYEFTVKTLLEVMIDPPHDGNPKFRTPAM